MTAASSLAFPGSRTLAGWWRQLAPLAPQALWVGHLFLHHVEALVASVRPWPLDPLHRFVLQALAAEQQALSPGLPVPPDLLERLNARLHLGQPLVRQVLHALAVEGLTVHDLQGTWTLTGLGREALAQGVYPRAGQERRVFHFVEAGAESTPPRRPPHFLYLNGHAGVSWPVAEDWGFDVGLLQACVRQPVAWKHLHGFPEDVHEILDLPAASAAPAWQRVIVDRPERLPVALVLNVAPEGDTQLLGFPVRQEGWVLQASHAVFVLRGDWQAPFPELGSQPSEEACRQAWQSWCQPRGLPAEEVAACALQAEGLHLRVGTPPSLLERLRATRSDALKGEAWLLIGDGALRAALLLQVAEAS
jgi:hypothetical protein